MNFSTLDSLRQFLFAETKSKKALSVEPDDVLELSLGIAGDDTGELMEKFFHVYRIDAGSYRYDSYFAPEGFTPIPIFKIVRYIITGQKRTYKTVRIVNLLDAIESGAWNC